MASKRLHEKTKTIGKHLGAPGNPCPLGIPVLIIHGQKPMRLYRLCKGHLDQRLIRVQSDYHSRTYIDPYIDPHIGTLVDGPLNHGPLQRPWNFVCPVVYPFIS